MLIDQVLRKQPTVVPNHMSKGENPH